MRRILITGANRGIGLELAREYLEQKDSLIFATCRDPQRAEALQALAQQHPQNLHILSLDVIERVPRLEPRTADLIQTMREKLIQHRQYVNTYGDDMPEIKGWTWGRTAVVQRTGSTESDNV